MVSLAWLWAGFLEDPGIAVRDLRRIRRSHLSHPVRIVPRPQALTLSRLAWHSHRIHQWPANTPPRRDCAAIRRARSFHSGRNRHGHGHDVRVVNTLPVLVFATH